MAQYSAHKYQSIYDLAIQLYGDFSEIGNILSVVDDVDSVVPLGTLFEVPTQTDPQALFFANRIVATDPSGSIGIFDFSFDSSFE